MSKTRSSHLGAGLLIGTIIGVATGFFLQSKDGKTLLKDANKKGKALQLKLMKEMKRAKGMSKAKYTELVDTTMAYYTKSKEIAKKDVPQIRRFLLSKWKEIEKEMKSAK